jgi:hypothetical protein
VVLSYYLFYVEKRVCLSRDMYVGDKFGMAGSNEDRGKSRRLGAEDRAWSSTGQVLYSWMIERSGDVVCTLHYVASKPVATLLMVWPQNHSLGFFGLDFKTSSCGLVIWPTNSL